MFQKYRASSQHILRQIDTVTILKNILLAVVGTGALALSAKVQIPFWPVQITMQSFTVVLIGALCGTRLATATLVLYLCEGCMGLPVFAANSSTLGVGYLLGPRGGYLIGFVLAAAVTGYLAERGWGKTATSAGLLFLIGLLTIEIPGDTWLAVVVGIDRAVLAIMPYQFASLCKICLGMSILPLLLNRLNKDKQ